MTSSSRARKSRAIQHVRKAVSLAPTGTALVKVEDPYEKGQSLGVVVTLRHDVLRQWHSREAIDDAQFHAGRWFQALWDRAEIGGAGAIDYSKPKVDGGYPVDPLTEKAMQARKDLNGVAAVLGMIDYPLVSRIVGQGVAIDVEAQSGAWGDSDGARYVAKRVKDALKALAEHRGAKGPARAKVRGWRV
jgi:hypothetical protein